MAGMSGTIMHQTNHADYHGLNDGLQEECRRDKRSTAFVLRQVVYIRSHASSACNRQGFDRCTHPDEESGDAVRMEWSVHW